MKSQNQEEFISAVKELVTVAAGFNIGDLFPSVKWLQRVTGLRPKLVRLHLKMDPLLGNIISEHKEAKSKP